MYCVKTKCRHINKINKIENVFSLSSGRNFVLRRRVNSHVIVIFDFIYDDIHVLNHKMKILEVYRLWKYTCIVVLLLFYNLD